ncbi:unnamed protein product [Sphagnum balticum]
MKAEAVMMRKTRSMRLGAREIRALMFVVVALMMSVMLVAGGEEAVDVGRAGGVVVYPVEKTKLQQQQPDVGGRKVLDSSAAAATSADVELVPTCSFPNTSMVSFENCSVFDGQSSINQLEICLSFLINQDAMPSAECCRSLTNVSTVLPACFCKVTFYPPNIVNSTQQKRMPGLCNVDTQLCQTCPQYMVPRENNLPDWTDPNPSAASSAHLASKVAEYRTTMTWLAVVLALTLAAIIASAAFFMHRRWKAKKKSTAALASKMSDSSTIPPGSDF